MSGAELLTATVWAKCNQALRRAVEDAAAGGVAGGGGAGGPADLVSVLVVLVPESADGGDRSAGSAAGFERRAARLLAVLREVGGDRPDLLWISAAVAVRVPVAGLRAVGELPEVKRIELVIEQQAAPRALPDEG